MTPFHITITVLFLLSLPKGVFLQFEMAAYKAPGTPTGRIVGGKICHIEKHPYMVSIRMTKTMEHTCGGTIISPEAVLTAAHCVSDFEYEPSSIAVVAGLADGNTDVQIRQAKKIRIPKSYSPVNVKGDLGIIILNNSLNYNEVVQPVKISPLRRPDVVKFCPEGEIIGWGETRPIAPRSVKTDDLRCAHVKVISRAECQRYWHLVIDNSKFCTLGAEADACLGDSGGPLMCEGFQVGIISAGNGCASPNHPSLYARVDYYFSFIQRTINGQRTQFCTDTTLILLGIFGVLIN